MDVETPTMETKRPRRVRRSQVEDTRGTGNRQSTQSNVSLGFESLAVDEDVAAVSCTQKQPRRVEDRVITGAERVTLPSIKGNERLDSSEDKGCHTVYVEKHLGFKAKPIDQIEQQHATRRRGLKEVAHVQSSSEQTNAGLRFVLGFHAFVQTVGRMVLGLMAGASLAHTLYVQSFGVTNEVELSGLVITRKENGLLLVQRYGLYAEPVAIAYYIAFIFSGSFILDRFDIGHVTLKCLIECVTFGNGAIAVMLFIGAFGVSNAMAWFNYRLIELASKPSSEIASLWTTDGRYESDLRVWCLLDACRTALLLATWVLVSVSGTQYDRLVQRLHTDPTTEEDVYQLVH